MKNHSAAKAAVAKAFAKVIIELGIDLSYAPTEGEWILLFGVSMKSKIKNHFSATSASPW